MNEKVGNGFPSYEEKLETFSQRLKTAIGNDSVSRFAKRANVSQSVMQRYVDGDTLPGLRNTVKIAEAANVRLEWLTIGMESSAETDVEADEQKNEEISIVAKWPEAPEKATEPALFREFGEISIRSEWLDANGIDYNSVVLARAAGDCMFPTIPRDGVVLVDTGYKALTDGVYLFGERLVRRLQRDSSGGAWLICDNPQYQREHLSAEELAKLYIVGQVIWAAGRL